jgi:hypothetical protein
LCGVLLGVFSSFIFAIKGLGKTIRYNNTRDANERATYCIIHKLFPIKTLRLMPASDVNLSIFFCSVSPMHLMPPILLALNAASLDCMCSRYRDSYLNRE